MIRQLIILTWNFDCIKSALFFSAIFIISAFTRNIIFTQAYLLRHIPAFQLINFDIKRKQQNGCSDNRNGSKYENLPCANSTNSCKKNM